MSPRSAFSRHLRLVVVNSSFVTVVTAVAGLALSGGVLNVVVKPVATAHQERHEKAEISSSGLPVAHGTSLAVLGGFRAIAADLVWLKSYFAWERRDVTETESLLQLTTALDGRPLNFWLKGARIIAFDIAAWRIDAAHGDGPLPESARTHLAELQGQRALTFLQRGLALHPHRASMWIERANIELNCLHDPALAAESYRRASELPDAPYYPARIHAELLRRLGRKTDALAWLVELYPRLPVHVEAAAAEVVLGRIRQLEDELSIESGRRFVPSIPGADSHPSLTLAEQAH